MRLNMLPWGIDNETKLKMKLLAAARGIPVYQLIDQVIEEVWEKEPDRPTSRAVSRKLRKEVRKVFRGYEKTLHGQQGKQ